MYKYNNIGKNIILKQYLFVSKTYFVIYFGI